MDQNQERRRGQFHRSRRGPDRRGPERSDRRTPPTQGQEHASREHVDVEQIMRDIRARIGQRPGIDLTNQQIQELAARRLEAILDPRSIKPGLLDELRRAAGAPPPAPDPAGSTGATYTFEDTTLYESHRGILVFFRKLFHPILKLLFNPNPLIRALNLQSKWNSETARTLAERDRRQAEWNALQYELVQRMVLEVSKVSLELQALNGQIESLSAKVDFNDRRVRSMEASPPPQQRPSALQSEREAASLPAGVDAPASETAPESGQPSDSTRRRRRRRRGRRGSGPGGEGAQGAPNQAAGADAADAGGQDEAQAPEEIGGEDGREEDAAPVTPMASLPEPAPPQPVATAPPPPEVTFEAPAPDPAPPVPAPEPNEPQG
jgi:hypothetical protein